MSNIINLLANLNVNSKSAVVIGNSTEYPVNPDIGQLTFTDKILSIYSDINGTPAWFPLFEANKSAYVHTQPTASLNWTVTHNLSSDNLIYFVYDSADTVIFSSSIGFNTDNTFELEFSEATAGKCIVFSADSNFISGTGSGDSGTTSSDNIASYFDSLDITNIIYNPDDTMDTITYATGNKKNYTYNVDGEPTLIKYFDIDGTTLLESQTLSYDGNGRLASTVWS